MIIYIENSDDINIDKLISMLKTGKGIISLDTETSGLDCHSDKLLLLQIGTMGEVFILNCIKLEKSIIIRVIGTIFASKRLCVAHNAKFDIKFLYAFTELLLTNVHDTLTIEALLNAGIGDSLYSLKTLVSKYCGEELVKDTRQEFYGKIDGEFTEQQIFYAANDVKYLEEIYDKQMERISQAKEEKVYKIELDVLPVVAMMEYTGIYLNKEVWEELKVKAVQSRDSKLEDILNIIFTGIEKKYKFNNALELADFLHIPVKTKRDRTALESISDTKLVYDWAKSKFNIGSPKQLLIAFNSIGISVKSTNEKVIDKLKNKHTLIGEVLTWREFNKRATTYGDNMVALINPVTNSIHTEYFNIGTATGRFSSTKPNLQNIPRENDYRSAFQAREGYSFISCDYNQQEYRLAGAVSGEPAIIEAYLAGKDMHTKTGTLIYHVDLDNVSKEQRYQAKTVNFAMIYWTSVKGLAYTLNCTEEEAEVIYNTFSDGYPVFCKFRDAVSDIIWELGYSKTLTGRRRYNLTRPMFMDMNEEDRFRKKVLREGFNHIIQGTGADITKMAMSKIFKDNPFGAALRILLTIHDEVLVEVRDEIIPQATRFIEECMLSVEQPFLGKIPAAVESHSGKVWSK